VTCETTESQVTLLTAPVRAIVHGAQEEADAAVNVTGPSDKLSPTANPVPSVRMPTRRRGTRRRAGFTLGCYARPVPAVRVSADDPAGPPDPYGERGR
jgi:hypothetical protein